MVPVYSAEAWMGLRFKEYTIYFDIMREVYEAFVIYCFYKLLFVYLGGREAVVRLCRQKPQHRHLPPFSFLKPWCVPALVPACSTCHLSDM